MPSWSETLANLRRGDIEARDRVVRLVIASLRSAGAYAQRDSWDDVVQDVLVTLLKQSPSRDEDGAAAAWIRRVALNGYVDRIRKEQGRRRALGEASASWRSHVPLEETECESATTLDERLQHDLADALTALSPRLQHIIEHKYSLGCTDTEGAARLGEALGTYKRLLRQALAELRQVLVERESKPSPVPSKET